MRILSVAWCLHQAPHGICRAPWGSSELVQEQSAGRRAQFIIIVIIVLILIRVILMINIVGIMIIISRRRRTLGTIAAVFGASELNNIFASLVTGDLRSGKHEPRQSNSMFRAPKDHINTRISHTIFSGPLEPECEILMCMWPCGPLILPLPFLLPFQALNCVEKLRLVVREHAHSSSWAGDLEAKQFPQVRPCRSLHS